MRNKIKGGEAEIYKRTANVEISRTVVVRVGLSLQFNKLFFLQSDVTWLKDKTCKSLKQLLNKACTDVTHHTLFSDETKLVITTSRTKGRLMHLYPQIQCADLEPSG